MAWQELTFRCDSGKAVHLSDLLSRAGAVSVSLSDASGEAVIESDTGMTSLWRNTKVCGLFRADAPLDALVSMLTDAGYTAPDISALDDQDWEDAWRQHVTPRCFGNRLWVLPSFAEASPEHEVFVRLDPGLAFGTGAHPTTAMCLEWLDGVVRPGASVIDYGCGSGILAIASAKLGAAAVRGVDTDALALKTARANARSNHCGRRIEFHEPQALRREAVDILVANIFAGPLIDLCGEFAGLVRGGGHIGLSGILVTQADAVVEAFADAFALEPAVKREGWVRLSGRRRGGTR